MRHLKRREQTIKIIAPIITTGSMGSKTVSWAGTPVSADADVQPISSASARAEYGERADNMRLVILPNDITANLGDGILLEGESGTPWIIVGKASWYDLQNLTIEKRA